MSEQPEVMEHVGATVHLTALHQKGEQPHRMLTELVTVLGSSDGADLILASSEVSAAHAAIVRLGGTAYLCDLGAPSGTCVNGRRIRWTRLADRDEIGVGPFRFAVALREMAGSCPGEEPRFKLRNGQTIDEVASIDPVLVVGSDPGCDVVVQHSAVAARHAIVVWTEEGPIVRDLRRQRSIRVNCGRVNFARLVSGDAIGVGPVEFIFEATAHAEPDGFEPTWPADTTGSGGSSQAGRSTLASGLLAVGHPIPLGTLWPEKGTFEAEMADNTEASILADQEASGDFALDAAPSQTSAGEPQEVQGAETAPRPIAQETAVKDNHGKGSREGVPGEASALTDVDERRRKLDERTEDLRVRFAAAQGALDKRASKYRDGLNKERRHLKVCRASLQEQAERLLKAAHGKASAARRSGPPAPANSDSAAVNLGIDASEDLRGRASELSKLASISREEIDRSERRLQSLHLDIQRLQSDVARTQQQHEIRDSELETRFDELEEAQQRLRQERAELMLRIRRLDAQDTTLQTDLKEAEGCRRELEQEAERLSATRADLDERQRDLRISLDKERRRIRLHREHLHEKTADLAKATHLRRCSIEEETARQKAELEFRAAEIKAKQAAINSAGRHQLEKTTTQLEEVMSIGLNEIEAELKMRQTELNHQAMFLLDENTLGLDVPGEPEGVSERPEAAACGGASVAQQALGRSPAGGVEGPPASVVKAEAGSEGRLEMLLREVEALHIALGSDVGGGIPPERAFQGDSGAFAGSMDAAARGRRLRSVRIPPITGKASTLRGARAWAEDAEDTEDSYDLKPVSSFEGVGAFDGKASSD